MIERLRARKRTERDIHTHVHTIPMHLDYYFIGNTWPFRDQILHHGGHWDKWTRRWYIDEDGLYKLLEELDQERANEYAKSEGGTA